MPSASIPKQCNAGGERRFQVRYLREVELSRPKGLRHAEWQKILRIQNSPPPLILRSGRSNTGMKATLLNLVCNLRSLGISRRRFPPPPSRAGFFLDDHWKRSRLEENLRLSAKSTRLHYVRGNGA